MFVLVLGRSRSRLTPVPITKVVERKVSGGYGGGDIPVPIPNTAVKPTSADGTWGFPPGRVGRRRDFLKDCSLRASLGDALPPAPTRTNLMSDGGCVRATRCGGGDDEQVRFVQDVVLDPVHRSCGECGRYGVAGLNHLAETERDVSGLHVLEARGRHLKFDLGALPAEGLAGWHSSGRLSNDVLVRETLTRDRPHGEELDTLLDGVFDLRGKGRLQTGIRPGRYVE